MKLYTENPKIPPKTRINKFSEVAGYRINTQKSLTFQCTDNELSEREINKNNIIYSSPKIIKYL